MNKTSLFSKLFYWFMESFIVFYYSLFLTIPIFIVKRTHSPSSHAYYTCIQFCVLFHYFFTFYSLFLIKWFATISTCSCCGSHSSGHSVFMLFYVRTIFSSSLSSLLQKYCFYSRFTGICLIIYYCGIVLFSSFLTINLMRL